MINWLVLTISPPHPDGDADEENFCGWSFRGHHVGGGESLLPAIWRGEQPNLLLCFPSLSLGTNQLPLFQIEDAMLMHDKQTNRHRWELLMLLMLMLMLMLLIPSS